MTYPRLRDLPEDEQKPFKRWLRGQTIPLEEGVPMEDQDFYYPWDYDRWVRQGKKADQGTDWD